MSAEVITLGCRLNAAEGAAMRQLAADEDDLVIVNSCAVTNEAVRQTRQAIRRAKRARPGARVVVTGCAAQVEPDTFAAMPEVSRVIGNREKFQPSSYLPFPSSRRKPVSGDEWAQASRDIPAFAGVTERVQVSDIMAARNMAPHSAAGFTDRARAFVPVQNGCDHRCTFCIIPYGRGNSRSVPAGLVVDRIAALVAEGCREVVLTGVDLTSYGPDLPGAPSLGLLVERILRHVPDLPRLRLSSVDCIEIDDRLFDLLTGEVRVMPHLHLSLQAGDDMILKRMKRRHSRAQAVALVERLKARRPEIAIGADLITGFPTETDAMAANSLALIDDCDIVMAHIFPYSPKRGTPAARMPQVAPHAIKERARRLREAGHRRRAAWLQGLIGSRQKVLVEGSGSFGHGESFAPVQFVRHPCGSGNPASFGLDDAKEEKLDFRFRRNDVGNVLEVAVTAVNGDILVGAPA